MDGREAGGRSPTKWRKLATVVLLIIGIAGFVGAADRGALVVSTYVGTGESGSAAEQQSRYHAAITEPYGLTCDTDGNLYFSDYENNRIGRVDVRTGLLGTVAEVPAPQGLAHDGRGLLYVGSMQGEVWRVELSTGKTDVVAGGGMLQAAAGDATEIALGAPTGVAIGPDGALYIADGSLHAVFRLQVQTRRLEVIAGQRGVSGFAGDGAPATAALLNSPSGVAIDTDGTLFIADTENHVVRVVPPGGGQITTLAGTPGEPGFAGDGAASGIHFNWLRDLELTGRRTLLIADVLNHRVREMDLQTGVIRTLAGTGARAFEHENVEAERAPVPYPASIAVDRGVAIYVSSPRGHRIFRIGAPSIVPLPWWMSPWTWLAALLTLGMLLYGLAEVRARQLRARVQALEAEVHRRTQRLAEQQAKAQQQADRLASLASTQNQMLTRLSSEFRAPLTAILESFEHSSEHADTLEERRYADVVERNAQRLLRLVDHMSAFPNDGALRPQVTVPVAALPILKQLIESFEAVAVEHGVTLQVEQVDALILRTTREAFELIAVNLLSNAIKYTPPGGRVTVSLASEGGEAVLTVSDTGRGIATNDRERVFKPFERAHDEGERIPGSGLGLALVREQAASQGGRVEIESEVGAGSTFRVYLPLAGADAIQRGQADTGDGERTNREVTAMRAAPAVQEEALGPSGPAESVLVIEDNVDMRRYLLDVLSPQFRCLHTDHGGSAIALAQQEMPDLVISDVMLPGTDGFTLCRELKQDERTCHIPVVLLTALSDRDHRLTGLAQSADDYLTKPFSERELLLRIRNLLDLRAMLQRRYARDLRFDQNLPEGLADRDRAFLAKLGRLIDQRFSDAAFEFHSIASTLGVSERQLQRKLKAMTGLTPGEWLRDFRLQRAYEQLVAGARAGEVAALSGFASHAYFTACFTARFGYPPSEARERARRRV